MSASLVVFAPSGVVHYAFNTKVLPFNDLVAALVNESVTELDANFFTTQANQRRFYAFARDGVYVAMYCDIVTTLDNDKIRATLAAVLKTYLKLTEDDEAANADKLKSLIDFQFTQLMNMPSKEAQPTETQARAPVAKQPAQKQGKKMRKWVDGELVEDSAGALDFSDSKAGDAVRKEDLKIDNTTFQRENDLVLVSELNDILAQSEEDSDSEQGNGFFSTFSSYFGSSVNIDELSKKFHDHLISKNIAPPTAKQIIDRIKPKLKGKAVTTQAFKQALTNELTKILSPNVSTDLLSDIKSKAKNATRPYVISVVGVNGVGKSTNLAKLAYWFLQNDLSVLICACDTFRSGAVEQLKVHVNNLNTLNESVDSTARIDLFEKGYGGGNHVVATARAAIEYGTKEKFDVLLIDTAGRTHSNAKLMAPLKKFGDAADPDKIIMVGEALVGTDSVEQAINFNSAFGNKRNLDFFIISKVDTVGDLVGTMINMVMATNIPILFMGTGQTYTDIKRLNVKRVVDMLMK